MQWKITSEQKKKNNEIKSGCKARREFRKKNSAIQRGEHIEPNIE